MKLYTDEQIKKMIMDVETVVSHTSFIDGRSDDFIAGGIFATKILHSLIGMLSAADDLSRNGKGLVKDKAMKIRQQADGKEIDKMTYFLISQENDEELYKAVEGLKSIIDTGKE